MRFSRQVGFGGLVLVSISVSSLAEAAFAWERLVPTGSEPSPRRGVVGILDSANNRLVFHGGETPSFRFLSDVWFFELEGRSWSQFSGLGPPGRCHHTFVLDEDRRRALLFGGFPRTNELWAWDLGASTWKDITPSLGDPPARCLHASILLPSRSQMFVYGGLMGAFPPDLSDTWSYSLTSNSWTLIIDDAPPGRRYGHVMALDEVRHRVILFGGFVNSAATSSLENRNDLWAFDLDEKNWIELNPPSPGPSPRQFARGDKIPDGSGLILFGGLSDSGPMNVRDHRRWNHWRPRRRSRSLRRKELRGSQAEIVPLEGHREYPPQIMRERAARFYEDLRRRRTVRHFSTAFEEATEVIDRRPRLHETY